MSGSRRGQSTSGASGDCGSNVDIGWQYATTSDPKKQKTKCNFCGKEIGSAGITRLKQHLAGGFPNVAKCTSVSGDVRMIMSNHLQALKDARQGKQRMQSSPSGPPKLHRFKPLRSPAPAVSLSSDNDGEQPAAVSLSSNTEDEKPSTEEVRKKRPYLRADDLKRGSSEVDSPDDPTAAAQLKKPKDGPTPSTTKMSASGNERRSDPVEATPNSPSHHMSVEELTRWYREEKKRRKRELSDLRATFEHEREIWYKVVGDLTAASRTEKKWFEEEVAKLRDALHATQNERDKFKEDVFHLDATLCKEREDWRKEKRDLQVSLDEARSATESRLAQLRSKQASELEDLRSVIAKRLAEMQLKHNSELGEVRSAHEARLAEERKRIEAKLVEEFRGAMSSSSSDEEDAAGGKDGFG